MPSKSAAPKPKIRRVRTQPVRKAATVRKAAAARKPAPRKTLLPFKPEISSADVRRLEVDAHAQARSERAWLSMTATAPDPSDAWADVEDHLLDRGQDQGKTWKYEAR